MGGFSVFIYLWILNNDFMLNKWFPNLNLNCFFIFIMLPDNIK